MNTNWKQDPRLKKMEPKKLQILTEFARQVETAPKNQLLTTLLTLNMKAQEQGVSFSNDETELLVSIMSQEMSPAEKKRVEMLRMASRNFSKQK